LKKQKAKKAGGSKKKEEKTEAPAEAETSTAPETAEDKPEETAPEPVEATSASPGPVEDDDEPAELPAPKASHGRKPSVAIESRQRSESFYRSGAAGTPTSPSAATPVGGITSEVYREQAQKIEELERENKRLASEVEENQTRWKKGEEELEELREGRGDVAIAVEKGKEADKLVRILNRSGGVEADMACRRLRSNRSNGSYRKPNRKAQRTHAELRPPHLVKLHRLMI
jgi:hypothetical protein